MYTIWTFLEHIGHTHPEKMESIITVKRGQWLWAISLPVLSFYLAPEEDDKHVVMTKDRIGKGLSAGRSRPPGRQGPTKLVYAWLQAFTGSLQLNTSQATALVGIPQRCLPTYQAPFLGIPTGRFLISSLLLHPAARFLVLLLEPKRGEIPCRNLP